MNPATINLVLQLILIIGMIGLFFYLRNTITTQKDTIMALKDYLEGAKIYAEIYDAKKIKELVDWKEDVAKEKYNKMKINFDEKLKSLEMNAMSKEEIINHYRKVLFKIISSVPSFYFSRQSILGLFSDKGLRDEWESLLSTSGVLFTEDISKENYKHFLAWSYIHDLGHYNMEPWYRKFY